MIPPPFFDFQKNRETAQYTSRSAITVLTARECLEKNLQKAAPNIAQTKLPEAPSRDSTTVNPASAPGEWKTGRIYRDMAVMA